jgi:uncharacterized membrane protein
MSSRDSETIVAVFDSLSQAEAAARHLRVYEGTNAEVRFSALVVVHETDDGRVKLRNHSRRDMRRGAETGLTIGLIVGLLAGSAAGAALIRTLFAGAAVGAMIGTIYQPQPDLASKEFVSLLLQLTDGQAGLVIRLERGRVDLVDLIVGEIEKLEGVVKEYKPTGRNASPVATPQFANAA